MLFTSVRSRRQLQRNSPAPFPSDKLSYLGTCCSHTATKQKAWCRESSPVWWCRCSYRQTANCWQVPGIIGALSHTFSMHGNRRCCRPC